MATVPHTYHTSITKRFFDIFFSLLLLVVSLPIFLLLATTILLTTGRPIIFTQKRTGKDNKPFTMYKFRTMYRGADRHQKKFSQLNQAPEPMFKVFDDPRFVGIGKWLSRTGLDELPQLLNILKGEMSFIGPRPLPVREDKKLSKTWEFRHSVRPGVFSEWSVSDARHSGLRAWKELDKKTLSKGGLWYELSLITRTLVKNWKP